MRHMVRRFVIGLMMIASVATACASQEAPKAAAKNDYGNGENWLCRPGRTDACAADLSTTVISADGKMTRENFEANPNAPIVCFYVYPTVSIERNGNSDMVVGPS